MKSEELKQFQQGPESVASLADTYLLHALDEFRNAGSAEMLYRELPPWYSGDSILGPIQQRGDAVFSRLRHLRATVLFAALAAEGYANEFLASHLSGRSVEAADRLPTTDKLVMGPMLAGLESPISYDREPEQAGRKQQSEGIAETSADGPSGPAPCHRSRRAPPLRGMPVSGLRPVVPGAPAGLSWLVCQGHISRP